MKNLIFILLMVFSVSVFAASPNCKITTQTDVTVTTASTMALATASTRKCLIIKNQSSGSVLHIKFGSAHSGTEGLTVPAVTIWEPVTPPTGSVYLRSPAGVTTATVIEGF